MTGFLLASVGVLFILGLLSSAFFLWLSCKVCRVRREDAQGPSSTGIRFHRALVLALVIAVVGLATLVSMAIVQQTINLGPGLGILLATAGDVLVPLLILRFGLPARWLRAFGVQILWSGFAIAQGVVLVVAIKLFLCETFIVPTGSMAETILGYHKDVVCPQCGHEFPVNAVVEVDPSEGEPMLVTGCTCPNCRQRILFKSSGLTGEQSEALSFPTRDGVAATESRAARVSSAQAICRLSASTWSSSSTRTPSPADRRCGTSSGSSVCRGRRSPFITANSSCSLPTSGPLRPSSQLRKEKRRQRRTRKASGSSAQGNSNRFARSSRVRPGARLFDPGHDYSLPRRLSPTQNDVDRPASIGAEKTRIQVGKLQLYRDVYYTTARNGIPASADFPGFDPLDKETWKHVEQIPVACYHVGAKQYFVLGDNSQESSDSRSWGLVPQEKLLGKVIARYFPFSRAGWMR